MNRGDESRFSNLLTWGRQHGATLNDSVEVYIDPLTKYSLRIKPSVSAPSPPFTVVTCPASITLSYLNALIDGPLPHPLPEQLTLSPAFPPEFMSSLPPHVIGRFFLIKQYLLGSRSFWHPYIRTLPQPGRPASWALPAFWPEEDVEFLEGTNAEVAVREVQANVKSEFKLARKALKEAGWPGWQDFSRLLYNWAFCIFTSRSFRPTTVLSQTLRTELREGGILPDGCKDDDFSLLMPVLDIGNHDLRARVEWDTEAELRKVRFVAKDRVEPGGQVCNNYGGKTNSELLLGYGFVVPETTELHNDYVHLRKRAGAEDAGEGQPKDFLVSLRSMADPSSWVGRSRSRVKFEEGFEVLPALAHVEDSLVWDLVVAQAGQDEEIRETVGSLLRESPRDGDVDYCLRRILAYPTGSEVETLVDKIKTALLAKLSFDYERILDPEVYEDGEPALIPVNTNQELATIYRRQCKKVLEVVITALGGQLEPSTEGGSQNTEAQ
jgi:hypothetical protein